MRGSLVLLDDNAHLLGIIPAGAGLTLLGTYQFFQRRDHPRGCGAHQAALPVGNDVVGSSPRVRGSQLDKIIFFWVLGIIPAGAGLTVNFNGQRQQPWDHPRGCGAHPAIVAIEVSVMGSSPRVRGSQGRHGVHRQYGGIIPAGAGLT